MARVYATSDLHGLLLPEFPQDADLVILGGDICPDLLRSTNHGIWDPAPLQADWLDTTFREWLEKAPCPVVATWGNHDYVGEKRKLVPDLPWILLIDHEVEVAGLRVHATPWVPNLPRWAFYGKPTALAARAELIPEGLDILVSHGPPKGAGDLVPWRPKVQRKYGTPPEGEHVGELELRNAIIKKGPRVTVCGHIHEDRGAHHVHHSPVYNVAAVDGSYDPYPETWVVLPEFLS